MDHNEVKADDPRTAENSVGYGKPPKATQFKKGQSGNRAGRPKTPTISDIGTVLSDILAEPASVRDAGRERTVSKYEVLILREVEAALKGDSHALHSLLNHTEKYGLLTVTVQRKFLEIVDPDAENELIIAYDADKSQNADATAPLGRKD